MIVFRLSKSKFAYDLSGKGAEIAGGRWNSKGVPVIYTAESRALCVTEIAVHTGLGIIPENYVMVTIEIPDNIKIYEVPNIDLSPDWKSIPHSGSTQLLGDTLLKENKYGVIRVQSAVVQGDYNYLINPNHPDVKSIRIVKVEEFSFDRRMFVK